MAAASNQKDISLETFITCSVCLESLDAPRVLSQCLHNYCQNCVKQLIDQQQNEKPGIKCPICDTFSSKDEICEKEFVNSLVNLENTSYTDEFICQQCYPDEVNVASWKCLDCRMSLCDKCRSQHLRIPILKGHNVERGLGKVKKVDKLLFCPKHKNNPMELFCEDCESLLCNKCHVESHQKHDIATGLKALESIVPKVQAKVVKLDETIKDIKDKTSDIGDEIKVTQDIFRRCNLEVDIVAEKRIAEIRLEQEKLKRCLKEKLEKQTKGLHTIKEMLTKQEVKVLNVKNVVQITLDKACNMSLLKALLTEGLMGGLEKVTQDILQVYPLSLVMPGFMENETSWKKCKGEGLLGQLEFVPNITKAKVKRKTEPTVMQLRPRSEERVLEKAVKTRGKTEQRTLSPETITGETSYSMRKEFFLKLQFSPLAKVKPPNLPDLHEVILDQPLTSPHRCDTSDVTSGYVKSAPYWSYSEWSTTGDSDST